MVFCVRLSLFCLILVFLCSSCNSVKRLIYLQDHQKDDLNTEKVLKTIYMQVAQYRLKVGDRLLLNIFSLTEERFNFFNKPEVEVRIDNSGQVELPVMGFISVSRLTIKETEEKLKSVAKEYLKSPIISVKLLNFNYTVLGEVSKQGTYNVSESKINILEAIGQAGGLTENANRETIRIIRNTGDSAKVYQLNFLEDNLIGSSNYYLQPNDIVLVDPIKSYTSRQESLAKIGLIVSVITGLSVVLLQAFK